MSWNKPIRGWAQNSAGFQVARRTNGWTVTLFNGTGSLWNRSVEDAAAFIKLATGVDVTVEELEANCPTTEGVAHV